ncbi:MAG: tetratricopeptide repeat protein [Planctomycetota bacterium]
MDRNGIRAATQRTTGFCAALISVLLLSGATGCSAYRKDSSIIRVSTKQNTPRANRLTYAGIRELNLGHIDIAAKKFREAINADYTYGPAHNNLGLMHYEQGNLYQAVTAFETAREFLPNDPAVVYNLGLALESAGRTEEALDLYYTANQMDRANPHFLGNLARLRMRMGEHDEQLRQQLRDLVLIETRPDWRRWADRQLGLAMNWELDRGPEGPDLESAANDTTQSKKTDLRDKIIDLTPVMPASHQEENQTSTEDLELSEPAEANTELGTGLDDILDETEIDDLSEEAYFRK